MTITVTDVVAGPFTGTGAPMSLPFAFRAFTELEVEVVIVDGETETVVDPEDYTVTLNAGEGGSISYTLADDAVAYVRAKPLVDQETTWGASSRLANLNVPLDRLHLLIARLTALKADLVGGVIPLENMPEGYIAEITDILAQATAAQAAAEAAQAAAEDARDDTVGLASTKADKAVATLAALALLTGAAGDMISVAGRSLLADGYEGNFIKTTANMAGLRTADTTRAIFVPFPSDLTGASGGWLRMYDGLPNLRWFGAKCDSTLATIGTDNIAAMNAAIAVAAYLGVGEIFAPAVNGSGYAWSGTLIFSTSNIVFVGEGAPGDRANVSVASTDTYVGRGAFGGGTNFINTTSAGAGTVLGTNPFATQSGQPTVTVTHASHGKATGDWVTYSGAAAVNGITLDGNYKITVLDANSYTVAAYNNANATSSGGGSSVLAQFGRPMAWAQAEGCGFRRCVLARSNAAYGAVSTPWPWSPLDCAFLVYPKDDTGWRSAMEWVLEDVRIINQPGIGVLLSDNVGRPKQTDAVEINYVRGPGLVITGGSYLNRTNTRSPVGMIELEGWTITDTGGPAVMTTGYERDNNDSAYRIKLTNFEPFYNCITPGIVPSWCQGFAVVLGGNNVIWEVSAASGRNVAETAATRKAFALRGHSIQLNNGRVIDPLDSPIEIFDTWPGAGFGGGSTDISIIDPYVVTVGGGADYFGPLIKVSPNTRRITARLYDENNSIETLLEKHPGTGFWEDFNGVIDTDMVMTNVGVRRARDFVAGEDCTDALARVLEGGATEWRIPPNSAAEPYLISEELPAANLTGARLSMVGAYFKRTFTPDPEGPSSLIAVAAGSTDFEIDGGTFDFDQASIANLSEDLATHRWAAVTVEGAGIARGRVRIRALNVPGLGVYVAGETGSWVDDVDVVVRSEGCAAALIYENAIGGTVRFTAIDSTNRFDNGMANFNGQVALFREIEGVTIDPSWIRGMTGKKNTNVSPVSGNPWSVFYSGLTVLNSKRCRIIEPMVTGMVNDEALDADCLNFLAMSFVGEDTDIISPRVMTGCNLAIEMISNEGGLVLSNAYVDQYYVQSRVSSQCQGIVWKGGGSGELPDRAGRMGTPGRTNIMNGAVVRRTQGDAFRFRAAGVQLSGALIADAPTNYGFRFDHLDKTSSSLGTGYEPRGERDLAAPRLIAVNPGKTGIALNCGERIEIIDGQSTGAGWNAVSRETACGISHPEQADADSDTASVHVIIRGGNYRGAPNETIVNAVSFKPGPAEEVLSDTPWDLQKALRCTDMRMGRIGQMFRIRDVMGAGVDALCRVIDQDGDLIAVAYEALQELSGTCTFAGSTLSGVGTAFLTELVAGQKLYWPSGVFMEVESVTDDDTAVIAATPAMTGTISAAQKVERVLTAPPDWTSTGFKVALTGHASVVANGKTVTGYGSDFDGEILGPCFIELGANVLAARNVTNDTSLGIWEPAATVTVTEASTTTAYMILADIETFDPMHHSIRFDTDFTSLLQILDPKTGNTISDAVTVPLDKMDGPSRFVLETRKDFAVAAAANLDILTLPVGFRPLGVSGRVHTALTGATAPTSLDLFVTDTSNVVVGVAVASLLGAGDEIPAGATGWGAWPASTAIPTAGWELRGSRVGGSGSFSAGVFEVGLQVAFDAPPLPLVRNGQL